MVRLAFIDASEKGRAFGQRANQVVSDLATGAWLPEFSWTAGMPASSYSNADPNFLVHPGGSIFFRTRGRQGLGIFAPPGPRPSVGTILGFFTAKFLSRYRDAEAAAKSERAGLWQDPSPGASMGLAERETLRTSIALE